MAHRLFAASLLEYVSQLVCKKSSTFTRVKVVFTEEDIFPKGEGAGVYATGQLGNVWTVMKANGTKIGTEARFKEGTH
jgi:hypothetical protein